MGAPRPGQQIRLRTPRPDRQERPPAWISPPQPARSRSELDALWDRFADQIATSALIAFHDQRVELLDGTPIEHAMDKINEFFQWYAVEGHAQDPEPPPTGVTEQDYSALDRPALEHLARRAFEHLHREATI